VLMCTFRKYTTLVQMVLFVVVFWSGHYCAGVVEPLHSWKTYVEILHLYPFTSALMQVYVQLFFYLTIKIKSTSKISTRQNDTYAVASIFVLNFVSANILYKIAVSKRVDSFAILVEGGNRREGVSKCPV
jgi:hypothetical protein